MLCHQSPLYHIHVQVRAETPQILGLGNDRVQFSSSTSVLYMYKKNVAVSF